VEGGCPTSFTVIYQRYRKQLLNYINHSIRGAQDEAEDLLQDVFISVHASITKGSAPEHLKAWLYKTTRNRCIDYVRRSSPESEDIFAVNKPPESETTYTAEKRAEIKQLVYDIKNLPESQRSALLMREIDSMDYAGIAEALDVSVGSVKSLLVRARETLINVNEARSSVCSDVRSELAVLVGESARLTKVLRQHVKICSSCDKYWKCLKKNQKDIKAVLLPIEVGLVAKLLGSLGLGGKKAGTSASIKASLAGVATKVTVVGVSAVVAGGVYIGTQNSSDKNSAENKEVAAEQSTNVAFSAVGSMQIATPKVKKPLKKQKSKPKRSKRKKHRSRSISEVQPVSEPVQNTPVQQAPTKQIPVTPPSNGSSSSGSSQGGSSSGGSQPPANEDLPEITPPQEAESETP